LIVSVSVPGAESAASVGAEVLTRLEFTCSGRGRRISFTWMKATPSPCRLLRFPAVSRLGAALPSLRGERACRSTVRPSRRFGRGRGGVALALAVAVLALGGCAGVQPSYFAPSSTKFVLDRYFVGHTRSWGVFENRAGAPKRWFIADSIGKRQTDGTLVLTQHFRFSDHTTQERIWRIRRVDANHWEATANDMVGVARGTGGGNAFYWEYNITVNRANPLATVHIRQWIYQPEGTNTVMTRLVVTKLGLTLFEVTESIHHVD
jgi:hypothetical protein